MKQVMLKKGGIVIAEVPAPLVEAHTVLVRVHYSYVSSGTESATIAASGQSLIGKFVSNVKQNSSKIIGAIREHGFNSTMALLQEKNHAHQGLGYSCSGEVIAVGSNVMGIYPGDLVACAGAGFAHHADMVSIPQQLVVPVRKREKLKQASITTIAAIALQGVRRAQLELGQTVCVLGLGLLGQITVQLAKRAGCTVIGIDIKQERLDLAQRLGADACFSPLIHDVVREITYATGHRGADVTIVTAASQHNQLLQQAMQLTRRKGRVVLVGDVAINFDREPFYSKEIDFLISCSYGPGRYDASYERDGKDYPYAYVPWTENRNMAYIVKLIEDGHLNVDALMNYEYAVSQAAHGYEYIQKNGALGIVLSFGATQNKHLETVQELAPPGPVRPFAPITGQIRLSMIGVGGFAKVKLLPMLAAMKRIAIHSIIDTDMPRATTIAQQYKAHRASNDIRKILGDDDVNTVVIASPHAFHADQALACLEAGKAVLVEKPAAVTFPQLETLKNYFKQDKHNPMFCVDFNRSCSPFMRSIKKAIASRHNPIMLNYRMNGNYLPKDHWIQSDLNRGRIIGEACHIFELFCFLVDAPPTAIQVSVLKRHSDSLLVTDNVTATISFADGSLCTLVYAALGHLGAGKEFMELFFDGKTITMEDYHRMTGHGLPASFTKKLGTPDKGHDTLFREFFQAATQPDGVPPIPVQRTLMASEVTLIVDRLARIGGGYEVLG